MVQYIKGFLASHYVALSRFLHLALLGSTVETDPARLLGQTFMTAKVAQKYKAMKMAKTDTMAKKIQADIIVKTFSMNIKVKICYHEQKVKIVLNAQNDQIGQKQPKRAPNSQKAPNRKMTHTVKTA